MKWNVAPYLLRPKNDNEWRDAVKELLSLCKGVVVECSFVGKNLEWELIEVAKVVPLDRVLLVCEERDRANAAAIRKFLLEHAGSHIQDKQRSQKLSRKTHRAAGVEPIIVQRSSDGLDGIKKMRQTVNQWALPILKSHPEVKEANQLIFRKRLVIELPFQFCCLGAFILIPLGIVLWLLNVC